MSARRWFAALVAAVAWSTSAQAADLMLFCAGAMKAPVSAIVATRDASAAKLDVVYGTAGALRERIAKGERPDLVILPSDDVFAMLKDNTIDVSTRRPLGITSVGVAVRAGAPLPDISTPDAMRATLLAAKKVVMVDPTKGTSGRVVERMFRELGIADQMRDKTIKVDGGYVVEAVARGEADLGLHQISEILPVAGVKLVGSLPGDLERLTRYDAAIVAATPHRADADALLRTLTTDDARKRIAASGFTPAR